MPKFDEKADIRVRKGIASLLLDYPFYGSILLKLRIIQQPIGTFGTDGRRLIIDPEFLKNLSDKELQGVLMHEATHVAALHPLRKGVRDNHMAWNIAADMEVNHVVEGEHLELPTGAIPGEDGLAEEHYAKLMEKHQQSCPKCGGQHQQKTPGENEGEDSGSGSGDDENGGGENGNQAGSGGKDSDECPKGGWCKVFSPGLKPGETYKEVQAEIEQNIRQAVAQAEMYGKLPAGMERIIEEYLTPKMKWDEILRNFVETMYEPCINWDSPSRRHLHRGIILPGNSRKRTVAEIAMGVDTSGSMYGEVLQQACSEVRSVIDDCYPAETQLPVIWFDTEPYVDYVGKDDELEPKGGGGTRFACVMEAFEEHDMTQKGLVIVTDGYCDDYGKEPPVPVLWVVFGDYAKQFSPPFGEVIELPMD